MSTLGTLAIALAGIALSMLLGRWIPTWAGSLAGLALVLGLLALRRGIAGRGSTDGER